MADEAVKDCCPKETTPARTAEDAGETAPLTGTHLRIPNGENESIRCYISTPPEEMEVPENGWPVILVFHDIFGYDSGRTSHVCDLMASRGFLVVAPDVYGEKLTPSEVNWSWLSLKMKDVMSILKSPISLVNRARQPWPIVEQLAFDVTLPYVKEKYPCSGKLGVMGFCWGGWACFMSSARDDVNCSITLHPSLLITKFHKGQTPESVTQSIKCPQLIMPSKGEPDFLKEEGLVINILKEKPFGSQCEVRTYSTMAHGWSNRGDIRNPAIKAQVDDCFERAIEFSNVHLK